MNEQNVQIMTKTLTDNTITKCTDNKRKRCTDNKIKKCVQVTQLTKCTGPK